MYFYYFVLVIYIYVYKNLPSNEAIMEDKARNGGKELKIEKTVTEKR